MSGLRASIVEMTSNITKRIAPQYIAGPKIEDAIRMCHRINQRGWRSTICPWDGPNDQPEWIASGYQQALQTLGREQLDSYLSIKVPSLKYDFGRLKELLDIASQHKTRIHFDSLGPDSASPSFGLLEKAAAHYKYLGCTLPSCWKRSAVDADKAIELGVAVRVVKGQWPDPNHPGVDPRDGFLKLINILAGKASMVAVASHDAPLATESLVTLLRAGTPCELEQLFGLPLRIDRVAKPLGITARIYVPYGNAYLPYALSEIRKRPVILSWLLKDLLTGKNHLKGF